CQAFYRARGEVISVGEALARMAAYFRVVYREEVELRKKRISLARREVMGRAGGFCSVPGCTRTAVHDHHIRFRSQGGSDEVANRTACCAAHHLRSVHRGAVRVSGRAGERLEWEFANGESFVTTGEDDIERTN
ncbi:MAG: HNH endonuclease signature motif containing protein, partial [Planctomycetota bacterium]